MGKDKKKEKSKKASSVKKESVKKKRRIREVPSLLALALAATMPMPSSVMQWELRLG